MEEEKRGTNVSFVMRKDIEQKDCPKKDEAKTKERKKKNMGRREIWGLMLLQVLQVVMTLNIHL